MPLGHLSNTLYFIYSPNTKQNPHHNVIKSITKNSESAFVSCQYLLMSFLCSTDQINMSSVLHMKMKRAVDKGVHACDAGR